MEKTKKELLEESQKLADKHAQLKIAISNMLNELDEIEREYNVIIEKIKKQK